MKRYCILLPLLIAISISCSKSSATFKETTVAVIPYKGINTQKLKVITKAIADYYGTTVTVLPQRELPKSAFVNIKSPRYRADSIIAIQERNLPAGVYYILGLTEKDISVTKHDEHGAVKSPKWRYNDFGVMGLLIVPVRAAWFQVSGLKQKISNCTSLGLKKW